LASDIVQAVRQYAGAITGDGATLDFDVVHSFGTKAVTVELIEDSSGETVYAAIARPDVNTVKVWFAVAPAADKAYTAIVRAEVAKA
jgi:hypothetical protein